MKRLAGVGAAVVVLASGAGLYAATNADAAQYRTTRVGVGDVEELLSTTGTVDSAKRADVAFQIAGTVASVKVAEGDKVAAGDVLATLDRTELNADLVEAKATLAEARATLADDQQAQSDSVSASVTGTQASGTTEDGTSASASPSSPGSTGSTGSSGSEDGTGSKDGTGTGDGTPSSGSQGAGTGSADAVKLKKLLAQVATEQRAVTSAASAASTALGTARAALTVQESACADDASSGATGAAGASTTDDASGSATADDAGDDASSGSGSGSSAAVSGVCTAALQEVQAAQSAAADAQDALQTAITTLSGTLGTAVGAVTTSAGTGQGTGSNQGTGSSPSNDPSSDTSPVAPSSNASSSNASASPSASTGTASGPGSATVTAAKLAEDQAAIDEARAAVIRAKQELAAAVVRASRSGRIVSLSVGKGADVSAGETAAVIFSGKALAIEVSLTEEQVSQVAVAQVARVRAPGSSTVAEGTVTAVGSVSTSTSGTAAFPATVVLDEAVAGLPSGASARVEIVTGAVSDVVRVPVSALSAASSGGTVQVLVDGTAERRRVSTGSSGDRWVEVTDGLEQGEQLVLADLEAEITGAGTSLQSNTSGGFPGGGFPGGSGGPGGAGGGRPGGR